MLKQVVHIVTITVWKVSVSCSILFHGDPQVPSSIGFIKNNKQVCVWHPMLLTMLLQFGLTSKRNFIKRIKNVGGGRVESGGRGLPPAHS